MNSESNSEYL